ncbi:hypothetical protein [Metabacillus endolithicus]
MPKIEDKILRIEDKLPKIEDKVPRIEDKLIQAVLVSKYLYKKGD